jgi:hypothetical protein
MYLTPWNPSCLKKPTEAEAVYNFPCFYETRRLIIVLFNNVWSLLRFQVLNGYKYEDDRVLGYI